MQQGMKEKREDPASAVAGSLLEAFERMGCGGIHLDARGHVVRLNANAVHCLNKGIRTAGHRLTACDAAANPVLQRLLDDVLGFKPMPRSGGHRAVALPRGEGHPLIVRAVPIADEFGNCAPPAALVLMMIDLDHCLKPGEAILRQTFGLTPAEARLAVHLVCGESLQDLARGCRISIGTVRMQLKSVFAKTRTRRQAELVALLARVALIAPR